MTTALPDHRDRKMEMDIEKKLKQPNETAAAIYLFTVSQYLSWSLATVIRDAANFPDSNFADSLGVCYS